MTCLYTDPAVFHPSVREKGQFNVSRNGNADAMFFNQNSHRRLLAGGAYVMHAQDQWTFVLFVFVFMLSEVAKYRPAQRETQSCLCKVSSNEKT